MEKRTSSLTLIVSLVFGCLVFMSPLHAQQQDFDT